MNPMQTIKVFDMHRCVRSGFANLDPERTEQAVETQLITSEVGKPIRMRLPQYREEIAVFWLRKPRRNKYPKHVFGKAELGSAYSALISREIDMPPVGTTITLDPVVTDLQRMHCDMYRTIRADAWYIFHVPSPLGTAVTLRIFAPEYDATTQTKGIIWRVANHSTVAVYLPHSNDLAQLSQANPRKGQNGLSVKIECIEDNTTESVETPLSILTYCCVDNIGLTGLKPTIHSNSIETLKFQPLDVEVRENQADMQPTEVSGDNPTHDIQDIETTQTQPNIPLNEPVPVEQPKSVKVQQQQNAIAPRWFSLSNVRLSTTDRTKKSVLIKPNTLNKSGESIGMPYHRNVWTSGNMEKGYMTGLNVKFKITRSVLMSGVIQIVDSNNTSSVTLVELGENKDISIMPSQYDSFLEFDRSRHFNNEWMRTDEILYGFSWQIVSLNRTSEVSDINVEILVSAGETNFNVSTKPVARTVQNDDLFDLITKVNPNITNQFEMYELQIKENQADTSEIVPLPAYSPFAGNVLDDQQLNEKLENDEFATEIYHGRIPVGENFIIGLNLAVAPDVSGAGGSSVIAEKFQRHAHIIPTQHGAYGPEIGKYSIVTRLPTTIAGHIEHVAIPGDMIDVAAMRAFGLASIISLAGAAMKAVGGSNMAGFIDAGMNVINTVKDIFGGTKKEEDPPSTSLSGGIPISRFVQFLKPVLQNEQVEPTFGALLLKLRDFIDFKGDNIENVPISVFTKLIEPLVEQTVFNRTVTPAITMTNAIYLPRDRYENVLRAFLSHNLTLRQKTFQNRNYIKFLIFTTQEQSGYIDIQQVLSTQFSDETYELINSKISSRTLTAADLQSVVI